MDNQFVYVTYIRTTPEELWRALTTPEFARRYWYSASLQSTWAKGAEWKLVFEDGMLADAGHVLEVDPPRLLVLRWRNEWVPENKADGDTICRLEIEPQAEGVVKLTVTHSADRPHRHIAAVANGWPKILSSLKTMLETGDSLPGTDRRK